MMFLSLHRKNKTCLGQQTRTLNGKWNTLAPFIGHPSLPPDAQSQRDAKTHVKVS